MSTRPSTAFNKVKLIIILTLAAIVIIGFYLFINQRQQNPIEFDGQRAYRDIRYQLDLGPRTPGSKAHADIVLWIQSELRNAGWQTQVLEANLLGHQIQNIIANQAKKNDLQKPLLILGAHYDSRLHADQDPDPSKRRQPVPGANDGASGVAVLLELARILPSDLPRAVRLVFFDAEDNGNIEGWDWILGSRAFVDNLDSRPDAVVIIDMIGDSNLNIHYEQNSDQELSKAIWTQAAFLGYTDQFIQSQKHRLLDDHIPFVRAGIPAVDLIDFDYPYWHTTADTIDKVSSESLQVVGDTLVKWLIQGKSSNQ